MYKELYSSLKREFDNQILGIEVLTVSCFTVHQVSPSSLKDKGVAVTRIVQKQGQFVIVFSEVRSACRFLGLYLGTEGCGERSHQGMGGYRVVYGKEVRLHLFGMSKVWIYGKLEMQEKLKVTVTNHLRQHFAVFLLICYITVSLTGLPQYHQLWLFHLWNCGLRSDWLAARWFKTLQGESISSLVFPTHFLLLNLKAIIGC